MIVTNDNKLVVMYDLKMEYCKGSKVELILVLQYQVMVEILQDRKTAIKL